MQCKEVYRFVCDNLDQSVDSPECRAIRKHLEGCPDCEAYLTSLKQTVILYRTSQPSSVPTTVHRRLMHALTQLTRRPHSKSAGSSPRPPSKRSKHH